MPLDVSALAKTFIASLLPGVEGRYAVVIGVKLGLPLQAAVASSLAGVALLSLALPILLAWGEALAENLAERGGLLARLASLYFRYAGSARRRAEPFVRRYGFLGLVFFVSIPFPATGIWTGSLAAHLLGVERRLAHAALLLGGALSVGIMVATGQVYSSVAG